MAQPTTAPATQADNVVGNWLRRAQNDLPNIADVREQSTLSWEIVRILIRVNDEESAETLGKLIFAQPHRWYYKEVLAGELARRGQFERARKVVGEIEEDTERGNAQIEIIQALALAKNVNRAGELADEFKNIAWRARAWGEIAAAQARNGDFAAARTTADGEATKPIRDKVLGAIATMQALAGDPAGARETAAGIKEPVMRDLVTVDIDDCKSEATFRKAWSQLPPNVQRWPLPPADAIEKGYRGLLFEELAKALTAADEAAYQKAIAGASGITARVVQPPRIDRQTRRPVPYDPSTDQTIIQRAMGYTFIAMVEAARKDREGAQAMASRAIRTAEENIKDNVFTGTCGPILVSMLVRMGKIDRQADTRPEDTTAVEYALKVRAQQYGSAVARALGYVLAEQYKPKELDAYLSKLDSASGRVNACMGVATYHAETRKAGK